MNPHHRSLLETLRDQRNLVRGGSPRDVWVSYCVVCGTADPLDPRALDDGRPFPRPTLFPRHECRRRGYECPKNVDEILAGTATPPQLTELMTKGKA